MSHNSPAASNVVDPWIGRHVGEFVIVSLLGKGGMGRVYRAVNRMVDTQEVAIKFLLDEIQDRVDVQRRFLTEARAISTLNNENVVRMIGFGTVDGPDGPVTYMSMEFLSGESLEAYLKRIPRPPVSEIFKIMGPAFNGVIAAHRRDIIHRDLKPENIFLAQTDDGRRIKVLDFGLARRLSRESVKMTQAGALLGTIYYMAPEQASGYEATPQSDVYAMGAVLYEMSTGCMPFDGDNQATILGKISNNDIKAPAPRSLDPSIPVGLEQVIAKAMAKNPDHRYKTMADMAADFALVAGGSRPTIAKEKDAKRTFSNVPAVSRPGKEPSMSGADVKAAPTAVTVDQPGNGGASIRLKSRVPWAASLVVIVITACAVWFFSRGEATRPARPRTPQVTHVVTPPPTTPLPPPPTVPPEAHVPPPPAPPPPTAVPDTNRPRDNGRRPHRPRRPRCGPNVRNPTTGLLVPCL